jgi:hypothetical protein
MTCVAKNVIFEIEYLVQVPSAASELEVRRLENAVNSLDLIEVIRISIGTIQVVSE